MLQTIIRTRQRGLRPEMSWHRHGIDASHREGPLAILVGFAMLFGYNLSLQSPPVRRQCSRTNNHSSSPTSEISLGLLRLAAERWRDRYLARAIVHQSPRREFEVLRKIDGDPAGCELPTGCSVRLSLVICNGEAGPVLKDPLARAGCGFEKLRRVRQRDMHIRMRVLDRELPPAS